MRLIFIRHAEPDYEHNTLTKKGVREAEILSNRVGTWKNIEKVYVSPLERAKLTAAPSLAKLHMNAITVNWLQEFTYMIKDPTTGNYPQVPWDFMPQYWTSQKQLQDPEDFVNHPIMPQVYRRAVTNLRNGLDEILSGYGYHRYGDYYRTDDEKVNGDEEKTLLFFGHLGANSEAIAYLVGISPVVLQQTVYQAPTSVAVLNFEKRQKGIAMARIQVIGSTMHLVQAGETASLMGYFAPVLQENMDESFH